jgi:hypothetical protein
MDPGLRRDDDLKAGGTKSVILTKVRIQRLSLFCRLQLLPASSTMDPGLRRDDGFEAGGAKSVILTKVRIQRLQRSFRLHQPRNITLN